MYFVIVCGSCKQTIKSTACRLVMIFQILCRTINEANIQFNPTKIPPFVVNIEPKLIINDFCVESFVKWKEMKLNKNPTKTFNRKHRKSLKVVQICPSFISPLTVKDANPNNFK